MAEGQAEAGLEKTLRFHYRYSQFFRVIHVDGVWGGPTHRDDIHVAVFSERSPIPDRVEQLVMADGKLGREVARISEEGITRELEVDLVMRLDVAKSIVAWLQEKIDKVQALQEAALSETQEDNK